MNTQAITVTAVLAAVAVVLNPAVTGIGVPAPYAPFLIYQLWEIPIVVAFLLLGPKYGISISVLNAVVLLGVFPGALITGPFYNLAANLSMLAGIYLIHGHMKPRTAEVENSNAKREALLIGISTALGIVMRVGVMTLVNYFALRLPPPIGYSLPEPLILVYLPLIGVFNATLALYTIPIGHVIADAVRTRSNLRLEN
jgi:riboflavin transporter FmnP